MMYKSSFWIGGVLLLAAYFVQSPAPLGVAPNVAFADAGPPSLGSARSIVGERRRGHILIEGLEPEDRTGRPSRFPARVGLRLTRGLLFDPTVAGRLIGRGGTGVPCEARVIESWEDGSVRALVLAFVADLGESYLFDPTGVPEPLPAPMAVDTATGVTVSTGALEVEFVDGVNRVFESARVAGVETLASSSGTGFVMLDEAGVEMTLTELDFEVERDDGLETVVRADGTFQDAANEPQADLSVRYVFYRDEAVVRIMHTVTWRVFEPEEGAAEWSLRMYPVTGEPHVGINGKDLTPGPTFAAYQINANEVDLAETVFEGRLDGWIEAESTVGLALAHPWQTYPTTLAADEDGALRVAFWPRESDQIMQFTPEAIMTEVVYEHSEFEGNDGNVYQSQWEGKDDYKHTGQGASRTHEVYVSFHPGAEGRSTTEMSALAQHPVVLRQDPASALAVPVRGAFDIAPTGQLPANIERALEALGAMTVARWASAEDYGFWRFGMARHGGPLWTLYRWNDGVQYDQQLIPWLLFMRGGDRRFFEEAMIMTRHLADPSVNHYNEREYYPDFVVPPGAMNLASGLPFIEHLSFADKSSGAHALRFATQLTGDERLLDVRNEVFEGAVSYLTEGVDRGLDGFLFDASQPRYRGHARDLFKGTAFFAEAHAVRGDDKSRDLFQEYLAIFLGREHDDALRVYRHPEIYVAESLLISDAVWAANPSWAPLEWVESGGVTIQSFDRAALRDQLEGHLQELGYDDPVGGVANVQPSIALPWIEGQTSNPVYGEVGWDIARTLADMIPDFDYDPANYPAYPFKQARFVRQFFVPILVNASAAARRGARMDDPYVRRDLFVSLVGNNASAPASRNVYVRARRDGDLHIELAFLQPECPAPDVAITITDSGGTIHEENTVSPYVDELLRVDDFTPTRRYERTKSFDIVGLTEGDVVTVAMEVRGSAERGEDSLCSYDADTVGQAYVRVIADGDVVHELPKGGYRLHQSSGQYSSGVRFVTRTDGESNLEFYNPNRRHLTVRDAATGALLGRTTLGEITGEPDANTTVLEDIGADRMVEVITDGDGQMLKVGESPSLWAPTLEDWFDPDAP